MGSIIWILLEIYFCFQQWNNFENRLRIDNRHEFGILLIGTPCILVLLQFYDVMHGWMDTVNNDISSLDPLESSARRQVVACLVQRFTAASLASTLSKVGTGRGRCTCRHQQSYSRARLACSESRSRRTGFYQEVLSGHSFRPNISEKVEYMAKVTVNH